MDPIIYYIKVGRRYKPVRTYDPEVMDALPQGSHLIVVGPGWTTYRQGVTPDHAPILAALRHHQDAVLDAIRLACTLKPRRDYDTPKRRKAWKAYCDALGDPNATMLLEGPSQMDIFEAMVESVLKALDQPLPAPPKEEADA